MGRTINLIILIIAALTFLAPASESHAVMDPGLDFVPDQLLVKFKSNVTEAEKVRLNVAIGAESFKVFDFIGVTHILLNHDADMDKAVEYYQESGLVEYAEKVPYYRFISTFPDDPGFAYQWGLHNDDDVDIDAPEVWDYITGSQEIVVAVVDTGVDFTHPDLRANIWTNPGEDPWADPMDPTTGNGIDDDGNGKVDDWKGWDVNGESMFIPNPDNDPRDSFGHGTHIAGIVGAAGNNGIGVTGVNWNVKVMCVKVGGDSMMLNLTAAIEGVWYAIRNGAQIISLSWGGQQYMQALKDAMDYANAAGIIVAAGAGNFGTNNDVMPFYPASIGTPNILSVAASAPQDRLAPFSCWGPTSVDVAAPGDQIYSTLPSYEVALHRPPHSLSLYYDVLSGTSMATPFAAGVCALVWAAHPEWPACRVLGHIRATVQPLTGAESKIVTGGMINVFSALVGSDVDTDLDGVMDGCDNCPDLQNPGQVDEDMDGWGVACDCDDAERQANPGMRERGKDGFDNDCDGEIDESSCGTYPLPADGSVERLAFFLPLLPPLGLISWLRRRGGVR